VIAYVDSSLLPRWLLDDEHGHDESSHLLATPGATFVTGGWTRIEVTGAVVRAARAGRIPKGTDHHRGLRMALGPGGPVIPVHAPQKQVEAAALRLASRYGLRAMDAWHLSVAGIVLPKLAEPGEPVAFASRDADQAAVAAELGLQPV
jgi:predicted nucleic acid-binding protein